MNLFQTHPTPKASRAPMNLPPLPGFSYLPVSFSNQFKYFNTPSSPKYNICKQKNKHAYHKTGVGDCQLKEKCKWKKIVVPNRNIIFVTKAILVHRNRCIGKKYDLKTFIGVLFPFGRTKIAASWHFYSYIQDPVCIIAVWLP